MCPTSLSWVLVIPSRYGRASSEEGEPIPMEHTLHKSDDWFYLFHIDTLVNLWFELYIFHNASELMHYKILHGVAPQA